MTRWIHFVESHLVWFVIVAAGQTLLGTLPTDVSPPLLVLMARGNVAPQPY